MIDLEKETERVILVGVSVTDEDDRETVFRFTMNVHWSAMRKYLKKYIERQ